MFEGLRQLRYPKEFRIARVDWPEGLIEAVRELAQSQVAKQGASESSPDTEAGIRTWAEVATGLWRLKQRMVQPGTNEPLEEMRRAYRHLESTWYVLSEAGVEIQDHTGDVFDPGMSLKVIEFQPTSDVDRDRVIETIKPTVYVKNERVQMGEVIVGTPETIGQHT